jgi:hypothetical protein
MSHYNNTYVKHHKVKRINRDFSNRKDDSNYWNAEMPATSGQEAIVGTPITPGTPAIARTQSTEVTQAIAVARAANNSRN